MDDFLEILHQSKTKLLQKQDTLQKLFLVGKGGGLRIKVKLDRFKVAISR